MTPAGVSPNVRGGSGIYEYGTNLNEEGDVGSSDDGSMVDRERNTWVDWCDSTFRNGLNTFPSDADDPQPMVVFNDKLFSDEVWADTSVSVREEVPVLAFKDDLISKDERTDEVLRLSLPMCNMRIHHGTSEMGSAFCLPLMWGVRRTVPWRWDWAARAWITGEESSGTLVLWVCLIALFRAVMISVHDWAVWSVWTVIESGYCRTYTWELGYLSSLHTPCDVDRLCTNMTRQI